MPTLHLTPEERKELRRQVCARWRSSPEGKLWTGQWNQSTEGKRSIKASQERYRKTEKKKLSGARHRKTDKFRETLKRYRKTAKAKDYARAYDKIRKQRPIDRQKINVRIAVAKAVRFGKIKRPETCSRCGQVDKVEGHHYKGYAWENRFDVEWLCKKCHRLIHLI